MKNNIRRFCTATSLSVMSGLLCGFTGLWVSSIAADEQRQPEEIVTPFNGNNFDGWTLRERQGAQNRNQWKVGAAEIDPQSPSQLKIANSNDKTSQMVNTGAWIHSHGTPSVDIYTVREFGDCTVSLEFLIPKESNSGVYLMGEYEVQIRDDYGKTDVTYQGIGAVYKVSPPRVNASRKPGEWQQYLIEFRAPRFKDGKKVSNARFVKVVLNGRIIQENVEAKAPTGGGLTNKDVARGPLMFQGDHGPVAFRNIKIAVPADK